MKALIILMEKIEYQTFMPFIFPTRFNLFLISITKTKTMKNLPIIESFSEKKVLVIGDLIIDEQVEGYCSRYADEANVPIMDVKNCMRTLGGAGNVAANLAALGAQTSLCSIIGDDLPKQKIHAMLEQAQIGAH